MYQRTRGLGQVPANDPRWQNLLASMEFVNANPLPANASADTVATRQLVIASLAHAEQVLQTGAGSAEADQVYRDAVKQYQDFAAAAYAQEKPSALALALANIGFDVSSTVGKVAMYAAVGIIAYLALPLLAVAVSRAGGSKSWH